MPRFKPYSYEQTKLIPVDLRSQLQPGTFEFALNQVIDELDLSMFDARFRNDETGAPAYDPAILLKVILLGYSRGLVSSRDLERACRENVVFMAISADSAPHFTTLAGFVSSLKEEIVPLFRSVLLICSREGLIGKQMFAIDGCKISSNCAKEWSGTRADFEKRKAKLDASIRLLLRKHREQDARSEGPSEMRAQEEAAIRRLRAKAKKVRRWLATSEDKRGTCGVKQSNLIDNESAKMPTAHGVVQGYNGVAVVDGQHQVVVQAEAFGEGQETSLLIPMVNGTRATLAAIGETKDVVKQAVVVADSGYHSEANMRWVSEQGLNAYIPDTQFRKRDPAFARARRYRRSVDRKKLRYKAGVRYFQPRDFRYDAKKGKLICPAGKELYVRNGNFKTVEGHRGISYMAKRTDCRVCGLRAKCLRKTHTVARQVVIFGGHDPSVPPSFTAWMRERFDSAVGRYYYSRRLGIAEPVFANIRHAHDLDHFTLRGRVKVDIQWKLYSLVHNIGKLARYSPRYA